jgi:hypothetical protein
VRPSVESLAEIPALLGIGRTGRLVLQIVTEVVADLRRSHHASFALALSNYFGRMRDPIPRSNGTRATTYKGKG